MHLQVLSIEGDYMYQLLMDRTNPELPATAERAGEMARGRPIRELDEYVATARQSAGRTGFAPVPERRGLLVAERSDQQVFVLERMTFQVVGRFGRVGDRPGEFCIQHEMAANPGGIIYAAEVDAGAAPRDLQVPDMPRPARCGAAVGGSPASCCLRRWARRLSHPLTSGHTRAPDQPGRESTGAASGRRRPWRAGRFLRRIG